MNINESACFWETEESISMPLDSKGWSEKKKSDNLNTFF